MSREMKILILNPHIDAQHPIVQALKARGDAVLVSTQVDEGWKVLQVHAASVDLAILHREGPSGGEPGAELNVKIKKNSSFADLPILFTSETWTDEQCASHQQTPMGANAYLHWPFDAKKIIGTIDAIFSPEASPELPNFDDAHTPTLSIIAPAPKMDIASMVLEDPSQIFEKADSDISKSGIHLSTFDGQAENTNIKLDLASPSSAPSPAQQRSGLMDVSKSSESEANAPAVDILEISLSEASAVPSAPAASSAPDLLSVEPPSLDASPDLAPPAPMGAVNLDEPPTFHAEGTDASESSQIFNPSSIPVAPPTELPVDLSPQELAAPEKTNGASEVVEGADAAAEKELPYLFNKQSVNGASGTNAFQPVFSHPVGDSVVPGGAANAPDVETLKKYLLLREQDVSALSGQLKATREENAELNQKFKFEQERATGLELLVDDQNKKIEEFEREKAIALETLTSEIAELRFQSKAKTDKAKLLEIQVNQASQEIERLKDRVRSDIRKIRVRERELENQLEMSKKDTEVVLGAREGKIVELKRKIDLLEFNMDLLQDRFNRERESNNKLREKLGKAAQVVRVAEGLLDDPQMSQTPVAQDAAGTLTAGKSDRDKAS